MLAPLKKHLLFAHSVFLRDNFYYCFDHVAETVDKATWRSDPNVKREVDQSILAIKNWLPILVELQEFIEAGILVFMPYYITPSFPYGGTAPNLREAFEQLRLKPDPKSTPNEVTLDLGAWDKPPVLPKVPHPYKNPVSEDDVIAAWLNARLMGLDVVFPDRDSFDFGSRLYVEDASNTPGPMDPERQLEGLKAKQDRTFALAAATLRQAMQEMPEISELSKHIMIEETDNGLNIEIVDQEGRSMFPDGAKDPYDRTRRVIGKLAAPLGSPSSSRIWRTALARSAESSQGP